MRRRADWLGAQTFTVLKLSPPKFNDKPPSALEPFFAALHGIYRADPVVQEFVSFEIAATKGSISFYCFLPLHLREYLEAQLYAQIPDLEISKVEDYARTTDVSGKHVASTELTLTRDDVYPILTHEELETDPLAGITAVMANLEEGEHVWLQLVTQPLGDEWQERSIKFVQGMRSGKQASAAAGVAADMILRGMRFGLRVGKEVIKPGSGVGEMSGLQAAPEKAPEAPKLAASVEAALKAIEKKATKLGYQVHGRLTAISSTPSVASSRVQAVLGSLKQFNSTTQNGFQASPIGTDDLDAWERYQSRYCDTGGFLLNIEELASVFHFPTSDVQNSTISWSGAKKGDAPANLPLKELVDPKDLTILGMTDYRNSAREFGIKMKDRMRHLYIIGKSGVGKSTLLENMIIDDVHEGRGVIVVDPHGELADKIISAVPPERIKDLVILDPSDREYPVAFNPLELISEEYRDTVASAFVGVFKKIFANSWGPRLENLLRNTVLALLHTTEPTMLHVPRMLTEKTFRAQVVAQVTDPVIRDFWVNEFEVWSETARTEAVAPVLNKIGQFLSLSMVRNIVGQPRSTIDIRRVMDEQKVFIVNLSKGKIGEDNMALLGAMIITKVQLAAMSRADVAASERPNSFLYVDEFQNFATDSFASILSEARKYGLGLTMAHQYVAQLTESVRDAVFGNVGTLISFRVGAPDAAVISKEFEPVFGPNDVINLQMARVYVKLLVDGIAANAFSAQTMPPKELDFDSTGEARAFSRDRYARPRLEVEAMIDESAGYKQKREAEEARSAAASALQQPSVTQKDAPLATPVRRTPEEQKPNRQSTQPESEIGEEKIRLERPLRTMKGYAFREVSQRGGQKWFLGEKEADVLARRSGVAPDEGREATPVPQRRTVAQALAASGTVLEELMPSLRLGDTQEELSPLPSVDFSLSDSPDSPLLPEQVPNESRGVQRYREPGLPVVAAEPGHLTLVEGETLQL